MAGIVGAFCRKGRREPDRSQLVRQMELLARRGPDDGSIDLRGGFGLGFRGQAYESRASQPRWDREGRIGVIFDGELEGIDDLQRFLESRGHRAKVWDAPDVVLCAYREWGDKFVERLSGPFALAVLDVRDSLVLLARDELGRRPLYFHVDAERLSFSSELRGLLADPLVPKLLEPLGVYRWFELGIWTDGPSPLRDIYTVGPGELILADREDVRVRRFSSPTPKAENTLSQLREELVSSAGVACQTTPYVALSGGRVSSFIASLRKQQYGQVATVSCTGLDLQDRRESIQLASELGFDHVEVTLHPEPKDILRSVLRSMDWPIGTIDYLTQFAWMYSTVPHIAAGAELITGHGACGPWFDQDKPNIPKAAVDALSAGFLRGIISVIETNQRHLSDADSMRRVILSEAITLDRLSIETGFRIRPVFFSSRLHNYISTSKPDLISWSRLVRGEVPMRVAERVRSRGQLPIRLWLQAEAAGWLESMLFSQPGGASGLLNTSKIRRWWYEHQLGLRDRSEVLWRIMVFEHWYQRVIEGTKDPLSQRSRKNRASYSRYR